MSNDIYFVYTTTPTGEETRTDICKDWSSARKAMMKQRRRGIQSRALIIDTTNEQTQNRSLFAPIYYTI